MKSLALLAVVAFVAVGGFPTSPELPPLIPLPAPKKIIRSSSSSSAQTQSSSSQDRVTSEVRTDASGRTVRTSTDDHSAEAAAARSNQRADQQTIYYKNGDVAKSASSHNDAAASKAKSASKDHRLYITDRYGNSVSEVDKASSASAKKAESSEDKNKYSYKSAGGGYSSGSSEQKSAANSDAKSAEKDYSKTVRNAKGGYTTWTDKGSSASRDANSSSGSKRRSTWIGTHGERTDTDSSRKRADSSHAASASADKSYVSIGPKGKKVIVTDKSASAEKEAASQYTHGDHGVSTDASGNTASWGLDGDHRKYSKGKSASRDRKRIEDDGKGNVKVDQEKARSASKKAASSDVDKRYKKVHNADGSSYSSSGVDRQAASSEGQSASIDKVSKRIRKGGITEITKEKRDSASEDANSSSGSKRRSTWIGTHGERTDTDSSRKRADSSHAASASADKSYVSIGPKGKKVIVTDKSASAEKEAASQYTHGDHGVSTDASGNTASWGLDGDHRKYSKGKSASRDRKRIEDDGKGNVKVDQEKARSASKKAASSDVDKRYKKVHNADGSSYSSSGVDRQAASSEGQSASIDKVSKRIRKGGITEITKEKRDSASEDANSSSGSKRRSTWIGAHGERTDTDSSRKRADSSHGASASADKSYVSIGPKGKKVIVTDKSASAEKEAASQYTHGDHGVSTDASGNTANWGLDGDHRKYSKGKSASRDRKRIEDDGKGNVKVDQEKARSASKKAASSDVDKRYKKVHNADGSSYSSSGVDRQAASSEGQSASIDKVSKRIRKGGITEITKEKRDSASEDANSSSGSKRRSTWIGAHGERTDTDSSRKRADSSHGASASADKSYVSIGPKGKKVIVTDKSASAEKEAASQYTHGDHGVSTDASGNTASWGLDGDHRKYSKGKSASRDRKRIEDDGKGNVKVDQEKARSASKKAASSDVDKRYKKVHNADGSSYSSSGVDRQAASSEGQSASIDKVSKRIRKGGITEITKEKRDSASEDANSSSGSKRRSTWIGAHGERTDTDSSRKRADSSHAASASADKSYVSIGPKGKKVIVTDKSASAEKEAASQYTHGDHGVSTDASGNTASWGLDGDHRKYSKGKSASRDRKRIEDDGKGNVKVDQEKARSASKKAASSDVDKRYKKVHNADGSSYSSSGVDRQAASSEGQSASIDKVSKRIRKGGITEITKEKRDSASEDANSSSGSKRRSTWIGAHGERTDTDSSRKRADSSHGASASADKSYVSIGPKGKKVIVTDKSASAEKEAASQYTHGDHGVSTDASGNTASWGLDGDHRKYSKGKSASRDRKRIVDDGKGNVKVDQEKARSASKKAASSDVDKHYKNVHNIDGSSYSSSGVDRQAASSEGQSASIDKVSKTIKKGGITEITKEKRDSASLEDNSSDSHAQNNIKRNANGGYVSSSASSSNAASNRGASESHDNEYRKNDGHGGKVTVINKGKSASKDNRSSNDYKNTNAYSDGRGNYKKSTSSGSNAARDQGASETHDNEYTKEDASGKVKVINRGEGQSKETANSGTSQGTNSYHNADGGSGWSSYKSDNAAKEKAAAEKHDNEYTKEDAYGKVKVVNKGESQSKGSASSSDYKSKSASTDGHGNSRTSTSSGSNAAKAEAASEKHDNEYTKEDASGKVKVINKGEGQSIETANSGTSQGTNSYHNADGGSGWSSYKSDNAAKEKAAAEKHDNEYTKEDAYGKVKVINKGESQSKGSASSSDYQSKSAYTDGHGNYGKSTSSGSNAAKAEAASEKHDNEYTKEDASGKVKVINKGEGQSIETANSGTSQGTNSYHNADGGSGWSSYKSDNAAKEKAAAEKHDNEYTKEDAYGKVKVVNKGESQSKGSASSSDYKSKSASTDGHGNSRTSTSSGSNAAKAEAASEKHDNEYTKEDASGKVKVINKGEGQSIETANSGTSQGTNSYHNADGGSGWSSYKSDNAAKEKAAAEKHDNEYTKEDAYGKVKVINKGESQSKGSASSSDYQSKSAYTDGHGNYGKSTSSGSNAAKAEAASEKHDNEYTKEDASGKVKVINKGEGQSIETANSGTSQGTNSYHNADGGSGWSSYKSDNAAKEKAAAEKHDNEYTKEDAYGKVKVVNKGESQSKGSASSSDYKSKSASTDGHGNSRTSTSSGSNAAKAEAASEKHDNEYTKEDASGKVKVINKGEGQSIETANSGTSQGTNSYHNADGGSGWSSYKSDNAAKEKAAAEKHDNEYTKEDAYGKVKVINKGESQSKGSASSSDYQSKSAYTDGNGNYGKSTSSGSNAAKAEAASEKHDNEYTKEDASGKVKVINRGESQSIETANSGTSQGTNSYHNADGGSGSTSYKSDHAAKETAAAEKHDNEYTKEDAYGKVKVINKGESQSKGSASSSDYQSKSAYTDGNGNYGKSTSSGSNAAKAEAASEKHDNEYTKEDASGKVKVINRGESQSIETANSGAYQGTNSYHNADGGSGWSSYEGDHEAIEKAAAEKHDNEYTKEDAYGKVKVINRGDSKSKETGSEIDYQNKSAYSDGKGNYAVTSASGRNAAASQAASTNYDNTYLRKDKDGSSEYSRDTGSGASESNASSQQQQSSSTFTNADGGFSTSNEKSRAATAHQAASANNDAVSIIRNADGSSVYQKSKTEAASVADASSSEDQKDSTTVDADGSIVTSSSKSSKAAYSSASSSSSSSEEVIDYC